MDMDQEICLCFHVTRRKIDRFLQLEKPKRAAQLSDCFGAGTGCGRCRPYLVAMFEAASAQATSQEANAAEIPDAASYAEMRQHYRQSQRSPKSGESSEPGPD